MILYAGLMLYSNQNQNHWHLFCAGRSVGTVEREHHGQGQLQQGLPDRRLPPGDGPGDQV